ncbi:MAG: hypothetical protein HYY18_18045 [Planctomycetes bacterium]|nr:hypothetical protein [Planctomycetota bacterium]
MKRLLLLSLATLPLCSCAAKVDPSVEEAWRAYTDFADALFRKKFTEARAMTAGSTAWGWAPKAEKEVSEDRGTLGSVQFDRKREFISGSSIQFRAFVTANYTGGPNGPVKKRYKHEITVTLIDKAWKVTQLDVTTLE